MRERTIKKSSHLPVRFPLPFLNKKEREAFLSAVKQLDEQSEQLEIVDPTETEPAILYSPMGGEK